ncbi:sugar fermentation stimulation protein [Ferroglobus placidus DSM 10642]|uniref:Sugar fermentation stimulation protein n=1 Tax=Ferroglobus placidus (strain DSM 10642 / AEDII12DO) TaxID=589924 RepID=D3RZH2_FERPA|nr:DNA/RNA nuclease SfsA [Ferroglobus placidus]ADC65885.1 sugar fermentation stimulation protein [Ferroglobus placidus DSM 10642]
MKLFEISGLKEGRLLRRLNRFTLEVEVDGKVKLANLRDSGRLPELMKEGNRVLLKEKKGGKTSYVVFTIFDEEVPVIVNSSLHGKLAEKILLSEGYEILKREVKVENSRIDFLVKKGDVRLLEVKGCTLVKNGIALFPDSPTERGLKHLTILEKFGGEVLFLVMRNDAEVLSPNFATHKKFAEKLESLSKKIEIKAAKLNPVVENGTLKIYHSGYIPVVFKKVI